MERAADGPQNRARCAARGTAGSRTGWCRSLRHGALRPSLGPRAAAAATLRPSGKEEREGEEEPLFSKVPLFPLVRMLLPRGPGP